MKKSTVLGDGRMVYVGEQVLRPGDGQDVATVFGISDRDTVYYEYKDPTGVRLTNSTKAHRLKVYDGPAKKAEKLKETQFDYIAKSPRNAARFIHAFHTGKLLDILKNDRPLFLFVVANIVKSEDFIEALVLDLESESEIE
jgi:hypothetical protein